MIRVVGEALVDLVISPAGEVNAVLGGAPFNTARAAARLGADVAFVGALSTDRFGQQLADALRADGVDAARAPRVESPTTLAAAELDDRGAATYRFYVDGTSAPQLDARIEAGPGDVVFTGGLGLVLEPMASVVETSLVAGSAGTVMVDVNCRPPLVADRDSYRVRVERVMAATSIAKVSDDDLAFLYPSLEPAVGAQRLIRAGADIVLVTTGASAVEIVTADRSSSVPVVPVDVVDTVGAGDTFDGALLAWLAARDALTSARLSLGLVEQAVRAANAAAAVVCTRRGADPPWRSELDPSWSSDGAS